MLQYSIKDSIPEEIYIPPSDPLPLVVFDFQVFAHSIHGYCEKIFIEDYPEDKQRNIIKAAWALKLNRGPDMLPEFDFTGVVVDDYKAEVSSEASKNGKGYWRHIVANEQGLQEYKIGRSQHSELFNVIKEIGYEYIKSENSSFYYVSIPLMEADDIAGKIARIKRHSPQNSLSALRDVLLYTVDGDWQGLVSDEHRILWCNTGPWLPRLRDEQAVCDYYFRKNAAKITRAKECYELKVSIGDAGDGLIPGSPLRLFDLINEDSEYSFSETQTQNINVILESNKNSKNINHINTCKKYFFDSGLILPVAVPPMPEDVLAFFDKASKERERAANPPIKGRFKSRCEMIKNDPSLFKACADLAQRDEREKKYANEVEEKLKTCSKSDSDCIRFFKNIIKNIKETRKMFKKEVEELILINAKRR